MTQIIAYLDFNGNCREAMTFYKDCLGGDLQFMTVEGSPMAAEMPAEAQQNILNAVLTNGGISLMASDVMEPEKYVVGNSVSLMLSCSSEEEIRSYFDKLAEGGTVNCAVHDAFWGALFGHCTDKFGVNWALNYDKKEQH